MPLPRPVPFFSQNAGGPNGPPIDDPTGCWYACAKMMGVYYEGTYFRARKGVPELVNPNGTHQSLGADKLQVFQINERLQPLSITTPLNTASDFDAVLTNRGPIMFTWWVPGPKFYIFHASVVVGTLGPDVCYHDPAVGPNQSMSASVLKFARNGPGGRVDPMLVRDPATIPKQQVDVIAPRGIDYASR